MASKPQVTLTFGGDSAKLEQAFDNVGASAQKMEGKVDDASSGFDRMGGGLDSLDDKAGRAEAGFRGTMDVMSGMGNLAKGNVLQGMTDLGGGVSSLSQGLGGILVPALKNTVSWLGRTRVGMAAQAVAAGVASAATKVWAGIQAVFNAIMALNPVVLITLAIIALIAVIVLIATKTQFFQKLWHAIWSKIGDPVKAVWKAIKSGAKNAFDFITSLPGRLRDSFVRIAGFVSAPFRRGFNLISDAWNNTVGRLRWTVPDWVPRIGGNTIAAPTLPRFHSGGVVPGAPGTETVAVLQAGERVTPAGGMGTVPTIRLEVQPDDDGLAEFLVEILSRVVRVRGGNVELALGGG